MKYTLILFIGLMGCGMKENTAAVNEPNHHIEYQAKENATTCQNNFLPEGRKLSLEEIATLRNRVKTLTLMSSKVHMEFRTTTDEARASINANATRTGSLLRGSVECIDTRNMGSFATGMGAELPEQVDVLADHVSGWIPHTVWMDGMYPENDPKKVRIDTQSRQEENSSLSTWIRNIYSWGALEFYEIDSTHFQVMYSYKGFETQGLTRFQFALGTYEAELK